MSKYCVGCNTTRPDEHFYASSVEADGLNRYCKHCCKVNRSLEAVRKRDKKSGISTRQKHRAIQLGVEFDAEITLADVFKKDAGWCGICQKWVQPRHASMDHILPLSRGGTHLLVNLQLTHLICNLCKGNSVD